MCKHRLELIALVLLLGCGRRAAPRPAGPPRVVSVSPSTTEAMVAIGAGDLLVGRSAQCDYPASVAALPVVGDLVAPNLEVLMAQRPSWVVGDAAVNTHGLGSRLQGMGVEGYFPPSESVGDVSAMLLGLGQRFSRGLEAERLASQISSELGALKREAQGRPRLRALVVLQASPTFAVGPQSYIGELLQIAGADNVLQAGSYPQLGAEALVSLHPDVVVVPYGEHEPMPHIEGQAPGWSQMKAFAEHAVCMISSDALMRPGPRVAEGARLLRRCLETHRGRLGAQ